MRFSRYSQAIHAAWMLLLALATIAQAQAPKTPSASPRLAELLRPGAPPGTSGFRIAPVVWPGRSAVENPSVPLSVYRGGPPSLDVSTRKPFRPSSLPEDLLVLTVAERTPLPGPLVLATEALVRMDSPDMRQPGPLPILAHVQKDKASNADPTIDVSFASVLKPQNPGRANPEPFTPQNLPDPFEFVRGGRLTDPPEENPMPPAITIRPPTK